MGYRALRLVIFGPPGSGKGTQAARLESLINAKAISTGELFRKSVKEGSELGMKVKEYMDKGKLVPDDLVIEVMKKEIESLGEKGFILDGFPRTVVQAKALERTVKIDGIIHIDIPREIIVRRMTARRTCEKCGKVYNLIALKPMVEGICDDCGGKLIQRKDDIPEVIEERLRVFQEQTAPLLDFYRTRAQIVKVQYNDPGITSEKFASMILEGLKKAGLYSG